MSSLLDSYAIMLGESVTWKQKGAVNQYNEPTYTDSTITVIWFDDERWVKTPSGESFQQIAYIQTTSLIEVGDMITRGGYSWPIRGLQKTPHPNGEQFRVGNLGERLI